MANKKTNSSENTKKTTKSSTTKKTTTKKVETKTTKKVAPKTASKKVEAKKVETKKVAPKEEIKKVETVKEAAKKQAPVKTEKKSFLDWCKTNYILIIAAFIALLLIINIVLVVNGHHVKLSDGKEVIATIDGKEFVAEDLFDTLKEKYGSDSLLNLVDTHIIDKELTDDEKIAAKKSAQENIDSIRSQYESAGYTWEDVLSNYGYASEDALLDEFTVSAEKETVAKNYIKANIKDDEINEYYKNNIFGTYTAKHILIKVATTDDMSDDEKQAADDAAKAKAEEVVSKLNNGEEWASLVTEYSEDDGSKDNEGLVENFTKGDVVDEFWNALDGLKDGEYTSEPVKSSYGYHVIYRVSYKDKDSLDKIKDDVVDKIVESKLNDDENLYTNTWMTIRKKYNFTINDTVIKNAYEKTTSK